MSNFLTFQWMTFRVGFFVKIPLWISQCLIDNNSFHVSNDTKESPEPMLIKYEDITCHGVNEWVNSSLPGLNDRHFADDIFRCIFLNENLWISLNFIPKSPINNIPVLVPILAWRRSRDKPLSEPMKIILSTHICGTYNAIIYLIIQSCDNANFR